MAFKCGFFTSKNGDRKYGANDMMAFIKGIVSEGVVADDKFSDGLQVQAGEGLNIVVKKGNGLFFNKWCELDSDMIFTVPTPSVSRNRVDSIVIKIDTSEEVRQGTLEYRTGDTEPVELINNEFIKEYRLANINVAPNAITISQANIEDTRPTSECGFVTNLLQNSDITATYAQWRTQFDIWFDNVRETLSSATLITSFTSKYITTSQDETSIPINIPQYKSVLDILQVYINGLLCFEGTDYTIGDFNNVILTNGVDKGTELHFVVYKSMDSSGIEKFVEDVDDLISRQNTIENEFNTVKTNFNTLESSNTTFKNGINTQINTINSNVSSINNKANTNATNITALNTEITNLKKDPSALWTGANTMGDGASITPSKKLSACKNGWILIWCGYNTTDGIATNTRFNSVVIPKTLLASIPANYMPFYCNLAHNVYNSGNIEYNAKMVQIWDDKITGFAGNTATDAGKGFCLKQVIEF